MRLVIALPYLWLATFFLLPFALVLAIAFGTNNPDAVPPVDLGVSLKSFTLLFTDDLYLAAWLSSLRIAAVSTLVTLVLGYPMAYAIARTEPRRRPLLLMLVMLPFWTSFLLRVYAWKGILADQGVLNNLLISLGIIQEPMVMLYTDVSMLVGMTYVYCPFMILPLYANLVKMDFRLLEAAHDLGASAWKAFWLITVPLSKSGIVAGSMLVFIPSVGEFVIPSLLGGAENIMIGRVVWDEMFSSNNWPRASALAVVMILLILVPLAFYYRSSSDRDAQGRH
jgi:putrescine transport system permease protein